MWQGSTIRIYIGTSHLTLLHIGDKHLWNQITYVRHLGMEIIKIMVIGIKNNLEGIIESKIGLTDLIGWGKLVRAAILKSKERASNWIFLNKKHQTNCIKQCVFLSKNV